MLGFHAVTLRDAIERPEALDAGTIMMTGLDPDNVIEGVRYVTAQLLSSTRLPQDYFIPDCSHRVVSFVLGTHRRHEQWAGLR